MPQQRPKAMKTWADLQKSITPTIPGEGERVPWSWFHRVQYVSGTTTQLSFFNATGAITISNMEAASQIPAPMYFDLYHIGIQPELGLSSTTGGATGATNLAGAVNDMAALLTGAIARFNIAQKIYFSAPVLLLPPGFGVVAVMDQAGTQAAGTNIERQFGLNGKPDLRNRYNHWGDITIPHNQNFSLTIDWPAAVTLAAGNTNILAYIDGYLYRRVL